MYVVTYAAIHRGYMPPEFVNKQVVSKKFDIFSLGVVITKIISGPRGHTRSAEIPFQEFLDQVKSISPYFMINIMLLFTLDHSTPL